MKSLADKHRRLTLLKGRFQKWKKRVCCLFASLELFYGDDCTLNYVHFFQCTSKKKLQALIGQWQKKAFGKRNSQILKNSYNNKKKLPSWSVCSFRKYRKPPLISPSTGKQKIHSINFITPTKK